MAQAQIDRKRSLIEQALDASMIEIKKAKKEAPKSKKEPKPKKGSKLKKEPKAKPKNRPPLLKLKGNETLKLKKGTMVEVKGRCTCDGKEGSLCLRCTMIPLDCPCQRTLGIAHEICFNRKMEREAKMAVASAAKKFKGARIFGSEKPAKKTEGEEEARGEAYRGCGIWMGGCEWKCRWSDQNQEGMEECFLRVKPKVSDSLSFGCEDKKKIMEEDQIVVPCPDGIEGCEVMHSVKDTKYKSPPKAPPNTPVKQDYDDETPCFPTEFIIYQRGKESATQCYWSLIIDAIVIALVQHCKEACAGCQSNSRKKHKLCDLPVKTVWADNRGEILARVDINAMVGKWASVIYSCCGICPSEAESMFGLCDPDIMLQGWQSIPHPAVKEIGYNMYDEERDYWRNQVNTRMAKIEHPASYCSFDMGLIPILDIQRKKRAKWALWRNNF